MTNIGPFNTQNLKTDNMANSEDPDEIPLNVTFYQGLHTLLRIIKPSGTRPIKYNFYLVANKFICKCSKISNTTLN